MSAAMETHTQDAHRYIDRIEGWSSVLDPAVNLCVHRRSLAPEALAYLEGLSRRDLKRELLVETEAPALDALAEELDDAPAKRWLLEDIAALARAFGGLLDAREVVVTLASVGRDQCAKFHVDWVGVRLLCTYAGPGTEWVREAGVLRKNLARPDLELAENNRAIVPDPRSIERLGVGDVGLLKGEAPPGRKGFGCVHRSAPVEELGLRRLLLKIDTPRQGLHRHLPSRAADATVRSLT